MAKNDFKAFATDRNANVISQEEWEALPALLSGFTAGKASSAQVNKVIRQASFIAAALAQFVSDKTQRDVLDNGDLPGFVELLGSGFAVEYLSRKNPFGDIKSDGTVKTALENLGLQTIKPDPVSTKIFSPDLKKFLLVSNTSWGMWNNDTGAAIALPVTQGGTGQTTVDGVKAAFGIDKLQPKGNYVITDASTKQSLSDALSCRYGLEVTDSNNIARVGMYFANNQAILSGINGKSIIIPDKAGTMALAGESVSALRLSAPREVTVT
ncbi:TPA: hypothetical protein ACWQAX_001159, partial [Escherichia coli]